MAQAYSDPSRENETYALPDVEVWEDAVWESECCNTSVPESFEKDYCPSCEKQTEFKATGKAAWWFWFCLPGCLPDSEVQGPYETEEDALAAAREE